MSRKKGGPTDRILELAKAAPGGVIRWHEADEAYRDGSPCAQSEHSNAKRYKSGSIASLKINEGGRFRTVYPPMHYRSSLNSVLKRHFHKVEGTKGYYVLKSTIFNDDWEEDARALHDFNNVFGADEFGMSTRTLAIVPRRQLSRMSDISPSDWSGTSVAVTGGDFGGASGRVT